MVWTKTHGQVLQRAFESLLGTPEPGAIAYVRCLVPDVVERLPVDPNFSFSDWDVLRVADTANPDSHTISADQAVERRESKGRATLLLVDTDLAQAGLDSIYSASREIREIDLFKSARQFANAVVTRNLSQNHRKYAERAIKVATGFGNRYSISPWVEFDFLCRIAADRRYPGELLHVLGLWPVAESETMNDEQELGDSFRFVDNLLRSANYGLSIPARIESLRMAQPSKEQRHALEDFLRWAEAEPILNALAKLEDHKNLWVGPLWIENVQGIKSIEVTPWRNKNGSVAKWSGLQADHTSLQPEDDPPVLFIMPDAASKASSPNLEIRWKARPGNLGKNAVDYRVSVLTHMDEELAVNEVSHSGRQHEKCRFSDDDFTGLTEDSVISAKAIVSVVGNTDVESQETEEFIIRYGHPPEKTAGGVGKKLRAFSEGLIELEERLSVSTIVDDQAGFAFDAKRNLLLLRASTEGKRLSFSIPCPPLIRDLEQQWIAQNGMIGRWRVKVRVSGAQAGEVVFEPFLCEGGASWERTNTASRRLTERLSGGSGVVGLVHDDETKTFTAVKEYIMAWTALLDGGNPLLALCNTVEVQALSGKLIGLIVLPTHPLRMAWHAAYDNLVLNTAFVQRQRAHTIRDTLKCLDGAMFPTFLPNPSGGSFVFADTLGFHAVGMVPETDNEPKASVAMLAHVLNEGASLDAAPTVGEQSAKVVGEEFVKYLDCHKLPRLIRVHGIRAGDGLTIAKSLGRVINHLQTDDEEEGDLSSNVEESRDPPAFVLDMYPSDEQRDISGRFIAETREKRRTGAGVIDVDDQWMLESLSLPGDLSMPRLRWARKERQQPETAAHIAVAFDTFKSRVALADQHRSNNGAIYAFGLLSFYDRTFVAKPSPVWESVVPDRKEGEKHPADRGHTRRLTDLQSAVMRALAVHISDTDDPGRMPALCTEVSSEKERSLDTLHQLCDWVITLDRNAGIEYFDSPDEIRRIYDAYVIDCVPEREDLSCLQMITSTKNLDEVSMLLEKTLDQMGLSKSCLNAEFLLEHLKSLSGRLAIRLTGNKTPASELVALAVSHAYCNSLKNDSQCWLPLEKGFLVPLDEVRELPLLADDSHIEGKTHSNLMYVTTEPRKGLVIRFVTVEYRRDLRAARSSELLERIKIQTDTMRNCWNQYFAHVTCATFRSVRRAKLARVLRFYADKAGRHHLPTNRYLEVKTEIDRMIERGADYKLDDKGMGDLGWVFCPEYEGTFPLKISPTQWSASVYMFGPNRPGDSDSGNLEENPVTYPQPNLDLETGSVESSIKRSDETGVSAKTDTNGSSFGTDTSTVAHELESTGSVSSAAMIRLGTDTTMNAEVQWPVVVDGNPHLLIAGLPGMGKTTCLLNICNQMIQAGIRPIIFSYHQDIDKKLEQSVGSIRFIDSDSLGFNPLEVIDRTSKNVHLDVAGTMRDIFSAIFPEIGDIQGELIRTAIKDSFTEAGWGSTDTVGSELQEPPFGRFVEILRSELRPDRGLKTLLARLGELEDYGLFESSESHTSLWESESPTVIRIHVSQNENLQRTFAALIFYRLYKDMFRRGLRDRITHAVIFDEAHRAARLQLIPSMAKECRKYGISLVLASQEARDFHVSVFSAIANYLVLRLTDIDAKTLVRNVASSRDERRLIDQIKQMDKFHALYFSEGKVRPNPVALEAEP